MKTTFTARWSFVLAALFSLAATNALAQNAPPEKAPVKANKTLGLLIHNGLMRNFGTRAPGSPFTVPATLENVVRYLHVFCPELNVVLTPAAKSVKIENLELHDVDMATCMKALEIATDGRVRSNQIGDKTWALMARPKQVVTPPKRTVEVFNLSGYIQHLGKSEAADVTAALNSIAKLAGEIVQRSMRDLNQGTTKEDQPSFQIYPGANLLIVIGSPNAVEITSKVVKALPGQHVATTPELLRSVMQNQPVEPSTGRSH